MRVIVGSPKRGVIPHPPGNGTPSPRNFHRGLRRPTLSRPVAGLWRARRSSSAKVALSSPPAVAKEEPRPFQAEPRMCYISFLTKFSFPTKFSDVDAASSS